MIKNYLQMQGKMIQYDCKVKRKVKNGEENERK